MRRFERRNDAFGARKQARRGKRIGIGDGRVFGAALVVQPGVLGADHGVVQAGGNGMCERDLPVFVLQHEAVGALQHAGGAAAIARGMFADGVAASAGFHAHQRDGAIGQERVEDPDGVGAAAHAGEDGVRQAAFGFQDLAARLFADDFVKIAHHHRIRVRAQHGAQQVIACRRRWSPSRAWPR